MGEYMGTQSFVITVSSPHPLDSSHQIMATLLAVVALAVLGAAVQGEERSCTVFYNFPNSCETIQSRIENTINTAGQMRTGEDFNEYFLLMSDATHVSATRVQTSADNHGTQYISLLNMEFEMRQTQDSRMCTAMGTVTTTSTEAAVTDSEIYCTMQDLVVDANLAGENYPDYQATTGEMCPGVSRTPGGAGCASGSAPEEYGPREFTLAELIAQGIAQK